MLSPSTLLLKYIQSKFNRTNVKDLCAFLQRMAERNLEASSIYDVYNGIEILWEDGFNPTHKVKLTFYNESVVGIAFDMDKVGWEKRWTIREFSPKAGLQLTIDETLEYIRHFIWANHNV
jgi:hypothetical protein